MFSSKHYLVTNVISNIVEKTKERYVLPSLVSCITCTSFNFWMFLGEHDTFAMVVNFINNLWEPTHVPWEFLKCITQQM